MSTTPGRVQMRRVKGWRKPVGAVYVGRPSRWGNPFYAGTKAECADLFRDYLATCKERIGYPTDEEIREALRGKTLMCWCPLDAPCHADVLLEVANAE